MQEDKCSGGYERVSTERLERGFVSEVIVQEDVEFTLRPTAAKKKIHRSALCGYMHPPLS